MTTEALTELLYAVLRSEASLETLFAALDDAVERDPGSAVGFMKDVEAIYGRNELRYDVYLMLRDRVARLMHPKNTRPPPAQPNAVDGPGTIRGPAAGATQLRVGPANPPPPPATDRTVLRAPTNIPKAATFPAARTATSRPPASQQVGRTAPPGSRVTGTQWEEADQWALGSEQLLEPGAVIKDRFVLEERIGAGGMGVVFKARDLRKEEAQDRDPYVAIKFLNPEFRRHPESFKAMQRETSRTQRLSHPNIVNVRDFDRDGTLVYMTMEFLGGEPLDKFIQRHPQGLRFKEAWPIIEGAGRALMYAHEQVPAVVHADFKPGNVFVTENNRAKVLDFGIARVVKAHGAGHEEGTRFDAGVLGAMTPAYASPEMLLGEEPDPRDDVYALATVAYELMTGRHPFNGVTAVKAAHDGLKVKRTPGMGRYQYKALLHGLAFRQTDRSPSVEAFLDELAGPFGVRGRALRQTLLSTVGTTVVLTILAGSAWWFMRPNADERLVEAVRENAQRQVERALEETGQKAVKLDADSRTTLMELAQLNIDSARQGFDPGLLSEGVSSALAAYNEVLRHDPKDLEAAQGVVRIVHLYEEEARRAMEKHEYQQVLDIVGYARKIDRDRESLQELEQEARAALSAQRSPRPADASN